MASSKEMHPVSRPLTHRPSLSTASPSGILSRQTHSRNGSHSLTAPVHGSHRVTRRKSMTGGAANVAAMAAVITDGGDGAVALPIAGNSRRHTVSRSGASRSALMNSLPSPPSSLPSSRFHPAGKRDIPENAIDDDLNDMSPDEAESDQLGRIRRASDGQALSKDGKKGHRAELRCEKCGKGYKHSSCLTKHLWEHTPEWTLTSKLLISKHQQVQLLEAASVLVAMNTTTGSDTPTPPDSAHDFPSESEPVSPPGSGFSEPIDRESSAHTTPPPQVDPFSGPNFQVPQEASDRFHQDRLFSQSYQPVASASMLVDSAPSSGSLFGHFRQASRDRRPPSSGLNMTGEDDRDLAAALDILSSSFNSNNGMPRNGGLPADAPPVPPLPAQYLGQAASLSSTTFINSFPSRQPESFTRGEMLPGIEDVKMEESGESVMDEDEDDPRYRARSDEDDDGVFGRMEE